MLATAASAHATEVTVAGFAFAGDYKSAAGRYPYSFKVFEGLNGKAAGGMNLSRSITERTKNVKNPALELRPPGDLVSLKSSNQALMATLLLSGETISTEKFGSYYKTFVNLRGDALIFDYKNQTVVQSYPVSVVLFDASTVKPSSDKIEAYVKDLLLREDNRGLISQFTKRLETAALPNPGTKTVQVKKADVSKEVLAKMPEALRADPKAVESMIADSFGAILSAKTGVPMLPNSLGHAGGQMSMRLENGDEFNLKVGEGDYLFDVKLDRFAKIETSKSNVSTGYVYGVYGNVHFYEPALGTDIIKSDFKNGEAALIPAGQESSDDFPAYQDAIRGMFLKLADALNQPESKWITTAASAKNILEQVNSARVILGTCK